MIERPCTADTCDRAEKNVRVVDMTWRTFGAVPHGRGPVRLVRLQDDNRLLFDILDEPGDGAILVVKVDSSLRPAVVGENLAQRALQNGWGGILIDGALRDTRVLAAIPLLIVAREVRPFRLRTETRGELANELVFGSVTVHAHDQVIADEDGIVFFEGNLP